MDTLSDTIQKLAANWSPDFPATLTEWCEADTDGWSEEQFAFRRAIKDVINKADAPYMNTAQDIFRVKCVERRGIFTHHNQWLAAAVDSARVLQVEKGPRGTRYRVVRSRLLPKPGEVPPLAREQSVTDREPGWFLFYGGDPGVLAKPHVVAGLSKLIRERPILDVLFTEKAGDPPALYSVRNGFGITTSDVGVDFPEESRPHMHTLKEVYS